MTDSMRDRNYGADREAAIATATAIQPTELDGETLDPAVSLVRPVPMASLTDLLTQAIAALPPETTGAQFSMHVDTRGVSVVGSVVVKDWYGALVGMRTYDGTWEVGGMVRWSPKD